MIEKTIYISHKFGNNESNKQRIEEIVKQLIIQYPTYCFISPVHCFSYLYDELPYDIGMSMCLDLLKRCDECWICSGNSKGVILERQYCIEHNIPCHYAEGYANE